MQVYRQWFPLWFPSVPTHLWLYSLKVDNSGLYIKLTRYTWDHCITFLEANKIRLSVIKLHCLKYNINSLYKFHFVIFVKEACITCLKSPVHLIPSLKGSIMNVKWLVYFKVVFLWIKKNKQTNRQIDWSIHRSINQSINQSINLLVHQFKVVDIVASSLGNLLSN